MLQPLNELSSLYPTEIEKFFQERVHLSTDAIYFLAQIENGQFLTSANSFGLICFELSDFDLTSRYLKSIDRFEVHGVTEIREEIKNLDNEFKKRVVAVIALEGKFKNLNLLPIDVILEVSNSKTPSTVANFEVHSLKTAPQDLEFVAAMLLKKATQLKGA